MQRHKFQNSGSFINQIMSNNDTAPELDQWVTKLHYSDRTVGKVIEVSDDKTKCRIQWYGASWNSEQPELGFDIGHQNWKFEPIESFSNLVYNAKKLRWETVITEVDFCKDVDIDQIPPEIKEQIYNGHFWPLKVIKPYTREKKTKKPTKVLFGQCDYYYDWQF